MLAFGGVHQLEAHAHGIFAFARIGLEAEGVVAQVFAGLDVVLVLVGPVQRDFLALVGDGVDARLVDALGQEVAFRVVAAEEAVQVIVDLVFQRADVDGAGELRAQLEDFFIDIRVHLHTSQCGFQLGEFLLQLRAVRRLVLGKGVFYLRQQVAFQEPGHFAGLGVHDPVDAEIQVRLVELEQLPEQGDQLGEFGRVGVGHERHSLMVCCQIRRWLKSFGKPMTSAAGGCWATCSSTRCTQVCPGLMRPINQASRVSVL